LTFATGDPVPQPVALYRPKKLHAQVVERLGQLIVEGHYAEGDKLPVEAELSAAYGVSHSVMREVIKILMAKGLVQSRPRVGTVVQSRTDWNMLDADVLSWTIGSLPESEFLDMLFDARMAIEPGAAQLAAKHGTDEDIASICRAYRDMEAAQTPAALLEPDLRFHLAIGDASHNPLVRHVVRAMHKALAVSISLTSRHPNTYALSQPRHKAIMQALVKRDGNAAARATVRLLEESREDFNALPRTVKKQRRA
jgi:DNA-binding FadR family transcriptional regulator